MTITDRLKEIADMCDQFVEIPSVEVEYLLNEIDRLEKEKEELKTTIISDRNIMVKTVNKYFEIMGKNQLLQAVADVAKDLEGNAMSYSDANALSDALEALREFERGGEVKYRAKVTWEEMIELMKAFTPYGGEAVKEVWFVTEVIEVPESETEHNNREAEGCEHKWIEVYNLIEHDGHSHPGQLIRYDCSKCGMSKPIREAEEDEMPYQKGDENKFKDSLAPTRFGPDYNRNKFYKYIKKVIKQMMLWVVS